MRRFASGVTVLYGTVFDGTVFYGTGEEAREGRDPGPGGGKPSPGVAASRRRR